MHRFSPLLLLLLLCQACAPSRQEEFQLLTPANALIRYAGRVDFQNPAEPILVGSASYAELLFSGDSAQLLLRKLNPAGEHNWITLELDGESMGRVKLDKEAMDTLTIKPRNKKDRHLLRVYKATEAQNGQVGFGGIRAQQLHELPPLPARTIEFIGNSITCGMGIEWKEVPCDSGLWYDQHNAYWAYGPRVARALNTQFMLSSVSGIGIYRNWNSLSPTMPQVYESLYLDSLNNKPWAFERYAPQLVSICLGTNDFSEGDGVKQRLPFDSARFVSNYIGFVNTVYQHYPQTQICLLTSPMVSGPKGALFLNCLKAVEQHFNRQEGSKKPIRVFDFSAIEPHGCSYHPDKEDHEKMAAVLLPFYKEVMGW